MAFIVIYVRAGNVFCDSRAGSSFFYDPNANSFDDSQNLSDYSPQPQYETDSCKLCENDSSYGYDCPPWFPLVYEQEPSYNQNYNDNYYPHNSSSFLCCDNCGGSHESFQCWPMNQNYFEHKPCYDSNYFGFDQPSQYTIDHQPDEGMCKSDIVFKEIKMMFEQLMEILNEENHVKIKEMNQVTHTSEPLRRFNSICYDDDDDEERTIPLRDIISHLLPSIVITTSPSSSVEDLVPIPSESKDTSGNDSECILPSCDYFSSIDVPEEKAVTFSNPLFNSNDDFTSSDDESLSDEDVPEENVKMYSNPLFEFDDEYISSDVNPLFNEVLENIESKDSYDSNLDEPDLLVTHLFDANKDECFDSGGDDDEINDLDCEDSYYHSKGNILYLESLLNDDLVHHDPSIPAMSVASILEGFTYEPPLEENDDLFDLEPKNDDWKKILYDAHVDDLMTENKVFDLGIHDQIFFSNICELTLYGS
uniref:Uncharacterized protein n=1 Tax=Tanacetum cinerariifolium TaxID=118510 RepID=A0A699HJM1_TANCI|nr:hypothetical protein [Tanacetum cinerariifolium]